jgi:hypothetical protein
VEVLVHLKVVILTMVTDPHFTGSITNKYINKEHNGSETGSVSVLG